MSDTEVQEEEAADQEETRPSYMEGHDIAPDEFHAAPTAVPAKPPSIGESTDEATRVLKEREEKKRQNENEMFVLSRENCKAQLVIIDEEIAKLKERKEQRQRDREAFNDRLAEISEKRKVRDQEAEVLKEELAAKRKEKSEARKAVREEEERKRNEEDDRRQAEVQAEAERVREQKKRDLEERAKAQHEAPPAAQHEEPAQQEEEEEEEEEE